MVDGSRRSPGVGSCKILGGGFLAVKIVLIKSLDKSAKNNVLTLDIHEKVCSSIAFEATCCGMA